MAPRSITARVGRTWFKRPDSVIVGYDPGVVRGFALALVAVAPACIGAPERGKAPGDDGGGAGGDSGSDACGRSCPPGPTDGLVAYWSMEEVSEDGVIVDSIAERHATCTRCP